MKNFLSILFCLLFIFCLTGCVGKLKAYNPLEEDEVITYAKNAIYEDLGEEVEIEITGKYQIKKCDETIDGTCFGSHKVPNTYTYGLKITSKNNPNISSDNNYFEDSYKEDDKIIERKFNYLNYKEVYAEAKFINELKYILQNFKYEIQGNQIFVLSNDYDFLHHQLFSYIINLDYIYYEKKLIISYDIYITKDEKVFNDLIMDYKEVLLKTKNIKNTYGYSREFMEIEKSDGYQYVFFRYSSNGCIGCLYGCSCSVVYGIN
ncbi:MAG: hypothetical protein ACI4XR_05355 [Bacilli bacterium]